MTHPCRNLRTAFGKWGLTNHCRTSTHGRRLRNHLRRTPLPCLTACRSKDNKGNHIRPYNRRWSGGHVTKRELTAWAGNAPPRNAKGHSNSLLEKGRSTICTHSSAASDGARSISIHVWNWTNCMNLSVNCWITGQSPSALAEEISTYEANIQRTCTRTTWSRAIGTIGTVTRSICSRNILRNTTQPTLNNTSSTRRNARRVHTTQPTTTFLPNIMGADIVP